MTVVISATTRFLEHFIRSPAASHNKLTITVALLGVALITRLFVNFPKGRLPPGPRGIPLLGNVFQLSRGLWHTFDKWKKLYGPIVYINLGGQPVIILNTRKAATELLDRRSTIYSGRPRSIVAGEILTGGMFMVLTSYGEIWRRMRRASHDALHTAAIIRYHPIQQTESVHLVHGLLVDSEHWNDHISRTSASTIMSIIYATPTLVSALDPSIAAITEFGNTLSVAAYPGTYLVEIFPFLEHVPQRFASWKTKGQQWFEQQTKIFEGYYGAIQQRVMRGEEQRPSFCATLAETQERHNLNQCESSWLAATLYVAGTETTSNTLGWFVLAMCSFPEIQQKAQAELDEIVGRSRMPTFADKDHLPYIQALVKEVLRWRPALPLAVPHMSIQDDWYEGYFIPKGTIFFPNVWSMNQDLDDYGPDAAEFNPERHLNRDFKDEGHSNYGFGKRHCVGRDFANNSLFIGIASILWALRLEPERDANGMHVKPDATSVPCGFFSHFVPFKCTTAPRFPEVEDIVVRTRDDFSANIPSF